MPKLFVLHKDNIPLALEEIRSVCGDARQVGDFALSDGGGDISVLAFTRAAFEVIRETADLEASLREIDWPRFVHGSFAVRVIPKGSSGLEKQIAKAIFHSIKDPKVDLDAPDSEIAVFVIGSRFFITRKLMDLDQGFEERKAHLRKSLKPISLHPKIARAMVNLTGSREGPIFDPCVGTGGILIEAVLTGREAFGADIDPEMARIAKDEVKQAMIFYADCLTFEGDYPFVVTDLPYAKNTKAIDLDGFFDAFLPRLRVWKTKVAILGFPDFIDTYSLLEKHSLKAHSSFDIYIHKSLSKRIIKILL